MTEAAVIVDGVSKRFRLYHERNQSLKAALMRRRRALVDEFWAVEDVSLEVPVGSTFGLIGENGSGKSTLLKCMTKILRPDKGSIRVNGKVSALLELGAGFHPELSGRENVFLNASILGLRQKEVASKFDEIVDFAGVGQFIDQPVKNYSSGMYVRLGFSVAINVDPDVLLVDEVLAVGDEAFQRKCNEKFAELREGGKTIVLVSHSMQSVRNLCDRVAWMDHGRLKMVDAASTVVDAYTDAVQIDREVVDESGASRWGSGEGRVDRVELLDVNGSSTTRVRTGEPVTIRLHYHFKRSIQRPVFGVAIQTLEGINLSEPNTRDAACVPETLDGEGYTDLHVDRLLLLPGTYDVSASLRDFSCLHMYDFRHHALRFDVEAGQPHESGGIISFGGRWHVSGADLDPVAQGTAEP